MSWRNFSAAVLVALTGALGAETAHSKTLDRNCIYELALRLPDFRLLYYGEWISPGTAKAGDHPRRQTKAQPQLFQHHK